MSRHCCCRLSLVYKPAVELPVHLRKKSPSSSWSPALSNGSENERHTTHNDSGLMLSEQQILEPEGLGIDLKSLIKTVEDEEYNRPRNGEIYENIYVDRDNIVKRLKFLSKKPGKLSVDEATEIYDASMLLKLPTGIYGDSGDPDEPYETFTFETFKIYQETLHLAGKKAHSGVLLMLQGEMIKKKGLELFDQSKSKLQEAYEIGGNDEIKLN